MLQRRRGISIGIVGACLLAVAASSATALELTSGSVKLTLYEGRGRFALAAEAKPGSGSFVPLLASEDPRTSRLDVVAGNKIYTMGDSPEFRETVEKTGNSARFVWTSSFLQVTESFAFVRAVGSASDSGVRIELALKNLSTQDIALGARYILDTYLGEPSFVHFRTDSLQQVTHELTLTPADSTPWWESPLPADPDSLGLQVMIAGAGITPPDRVVFANWKRLTDSAWIFDSSSVRTFSLLPYSVNDSAAAQYYDPHTVAHGGESVISLVMGRFSRSGLITAAPEAPPAATGSVMQSAAPAASGANKAAMDDLASVDAILSEIDAALGAGTPLTSERLAAIESQLKDLSSRGSGGGTGSGK